MVALAVAVAVAPLQFRLRLVRCNSNWRCSCLREAEAEAESEGELPGRERRRQRQQRREAKSSSDPLVANWREHLEDRLLLEAKNYKKLQKLRRDSQFTINTLSSLGPQWWALHVSPHRSPDTAASLSSSLSASFPDLHFKLYNPCVSHRILLKDGFIRLRHRPLRPGTMYLHCTLNRQLHHLVESSPGVLAFRGSQIVARDEFFTKPKPVSPHEIEALLLQEKEEQHAADQAFQQKQAQANKLPRTKKLNYAYLFPGVTVRLLSGPFADYTGSIKELNLKKKKATVELLLFGKESTVELNIDQIEAVTAASQAK